MGVCFLLRCCCVHIVPFPSVVGEGDEDMDEVEFWHPHDADEGGKDMAGVHLAVAARFVMKVSGSWSSISDIFMEARIDLALSEILAAAAAAAFGAYELLQCYKYNSSHIIYVLKLPWLVEVYVLCRGRCLALLWLVEAGMLYSIYCAVCLPLLLCWRRVLQRSLHGLQHEGLRETSPANVDSCSISSGGVTRGLRPRYRQYCP